MSVPTPLFYGRCDKRGKVVFDDALAWSKQCWSLAGQSAEVTLRKRRNQRSLKANAFYWAAHVKAISDYTGYEEDEVHEILKAKFLPKSITLSDANGEVKEEVTIGRSTTKLSTVEFTEYLRRVEQFAAKLGCFIPDQDSVDLGAEVTE